MVMIIKKHAGVSLLVKTANNILATIFQMKRNNIQI